MAAGAAPAPEAKADTKTETKQTAPALPTTPWQRFQQKLHEIFAGREDHAGWHQ
jgi:hypothetical protein